MGDPWVIGSFFGWVAAGFALWRLRSKFDHRLRLWPHNLRLAGGILLLILSAVILIGSFWLMGSFRFRIQGVGYLAAFLVGLLYVSAQTFAVILTLSMTDIGVTNGVAPPSINEGKDS